MEHKHVTLYIVFYSVARVYESWIRSNKDVRVIQG